MRVSRCAQSIGYPSIVFLSSKKKPQSPRRPSPSGCKRADTSTGASAGDGDAAAMTLATFHPTIAKTWLAASSNKMLQPHHISPGSRKLAWWCCPACAHQFNKRVDLHVAAGGRCPKCHKRPALASLAQSGDTVVEDLSVAVQHRCRPDSSLGTLAAPNANRIKKSVADNQYLRVSDTRNLLPMLAKNYEKEGAKIADDEEIFVSPKLDGIRCVTAYDAKNKRILFFSRSGTLFECCDEKIDPALRYLFERDTALVLDGELYNDSVNQANAAAATSVSVSPPQSSGLLFSLMMDEKRETSVSGTRSKRNCTSTRASGGGDDVIGFQELTSAIRTTRERSTPEVAAMQGKLQYHIFDVLYATKFISTGNAAPYSERYAFLTRMIADVTANNQRTIKNYDPRVLSVVPSLKCTRKDVDGALRDALSIGYEGVMVRRDGRAAAAPSAHKSSHGHRVHSAQRRIKRPTSTAPADSGAYAYGQRSGNLLKYKVMKDDEFVIVSAVEGKGKWKGRLGAFVCQTKDKKKTFTVTPASTDDQKKRMWNNWRKNYVGKALTVQYQELTVDGIPRFPVGKCVRGVATGEDWI